MSEPFLLYDPDGERQVISSPSYAAQLLVSGEWSLKPGELKKVADGEVADDASDPDSWNGLNVRLRQALMQAGYVTPAAVRNLSDAELLGIKDIGDKALVRIREALGAASS